jgi:hypothetical protein
MKKFLTITLVLCSVIIYAQTSIGLRAGLNFSKVNLSGDDVTAEDTDPLKNISGLNIAIPIEFKLSNKFAIQPEVSFSQRGFKYKVDFLGLPLSVRTKYNYLEVPVLAKLSLGGEKNKFNVLVGPSFGYALSGNYNDGEESLKIDFKEEGVKRFDFGAQFGLGATFGNFFVDARYLLGLANLNDESTLDVKVNTRGLGFNVGYLYTLGSK